jgi:hypothetical protein
MDSGQNVKRVCKKLTLHLNNILQFKFSKSVHGSTLCVKQGLNINNARNMYSSMILSFFRKFLWKELLLILEFLNYSAGLL